MKRLISNIKLRKCTFLKQKKAFNFKHFLKLRESLVPPFWQVVPPWFSPEGKKGLLRIHPGAGFGTGTHETTQLCLELMGQFAHPPLLGLDFGSGSGILSIALASLGAQVDSIEIDPLATQNALENAKLNQVDPCISFFTHLPESPKKYGLIVANILKPVLLAFAERLTSRLQASGILILSGLMAQDLPEISETYLKLLHGFSQKVLEKNEWRALCFKAKG